MYLPTEIETTLYTHGQNSQDPLTSVSSEKGKSFTYSIDGWYITSTVWKCRLTLLLPCLLPNICIFLPSGIEAIVSNIRRMVRLRFISFRE